MSMRKAIAFMAVFACLSIVAFQYPEATFSWQQSGSNAQSKTVIEMTVEELRQRYALELSGLNFDPKQDSLSLLLKNVGNNVETFFRDLANTVSKEHVQLGNNLGYLHEEYSYLILPQRTGFPWTEDRTDKEGRPVNLGFPGYCISKGYAYACIYLHPDHQKGSVFRYLGRMTKGPDAYLLAFAQKPEAEDYLTSYYIAERAFLMQFLVQGFIWLDPDSYQILRMKTFMLMPDAVLKVQTTDIYYKEVRFDNAQQSFRLPKEVDILWELPNVTYKNKHKYSDYKLFSVNTTYKLIPPKTNK
jgi:hypothetical protein